MKGEKRGKNRRRRSGKTERRNTGEGRQGTGRGVV